MQAVARVKVTESPAQLPSFLPGDRLPEGAAVVTASAFRPRLPVSSPAPSLSQRWLVIATLRDLLGAHVCVIVTPRSHRINDSEIQL